MCGRIFHTLAIDELPTAESNDLSVAPLVALSYCGAMVLRTTQRFVRRGRLGSTSPPV